jgi:hypothetical protein
MNKKYTLILSISFFVLVSTSYFWEKWLGFLLIPITIILFLLFWVLVINLIVLFFQLIRHKFRDKDKLKGAIASLIILIAVFLFPYGLIDFEQFEGKDYIVAQREGSANCTTTLKIKENNQFVLKHICFGYEEEKGTYKMKGDTIFLVFDKTLEKAFVVMSLKRENYENKLGELDYFRGGNYTNPLILTIHKYNKIPLNIPDKN